MKARSKVWRGMVIGMVLCCAPVATRGQLRVTVRETSGNMLSSEATIRITQLSKGTNGVAMTAREAQTNGGAAMIDIWPGEYVVEAEAPGYQKSTTQANVQGGMTTELRMYLVPLKKAGESAAPPAGVMMSPALKEEMEKASRALSERNLAEARKELTKALELAPSNPDALYLLGVVEYTEKNVAAARKDFEAVLGRYPEHAGSLLMLGQIELETGDKQAAVPLLERAVAAAPDRWLAHELLANAYARTGQLEKAWTEAEKTVDLNREKLPAMRILEVKILLKEKKYAEAEEALAAFVKEFPNDPGVAAARKKLDQLKAAEAEKR